MAPPHSPKSGGFANLSGASLFSSVESTKQTYQAPASGCSSMPNFGFGTSNTAADFNRNTTPTFGFPSTQPAFGISSTPSSMPSSSATPTFGFPSTGPGFANTNSPFGGRPDVAKTPTWGSNSGASQPPSSPFGTGFSTNPPSSPFGTGFNRNPPSSPFGTGSNSNLPSSPFHGPFGQKSTANFSFLPFPNTSNSGGDPTTIGGLVAASPSMPAFATSNTAAGFNQNTTPEPAFGIPSTSSSASTTFGFPSTGPGFANTKSPFETRVSASPFSIKSGQPPLSSHDGGSRITPYSASKMDGEDCTKVISISAMPLYSAKSHEELRLEDYQQRTKANPFSNALSNNNEVHPPLASQIKGSGVAPYTLTKPVGEEDSAKLISISAMPFYEVKCHEELRWEDYQLKNEGGNGVAGALNQKPNQFIPPTSLTQTSETPSPFSSKIPISAASFYPFPSPPIANITTKTTEQPSPFSDKMPNATSFFGPFPFQPSVETPLSSTPTNIISGESRIHDLTTNSSQTWQPSTSTGAVPCTACGCIKTNASPLQVQITAESCQTKPFDPAVAKPPTMADNIVPVKDPFGVASSKSQLLADHATPATSVQIGISSMPVVDKPAPSRICSVLTLRLFSQRHSSVHLKKGQPKYHVEKKVPFFTQADPHGIPRPINHPIPRENPKSAFMMNIPEPTDNDNNVEQELHVVTGLDLVPKLTRSDYYTEPLISELETKESLDPGFCGRVRGFVIGRHGYGKIEFEGETDVRGLDLDSLVEFNAKEVVVYKDESKKVEVGKELNKPALVTLMNVKCVDKKTGEVFVDGDQVTKYERMLKKMAQKQGAEFVSYDPVKGEWKFHVHHF